MDSVRARPFTAMRSLLADITGHKRRNKQRKKKPTKQTQTTNQPTKPNQTKPTQPTEQTNKPNQPTSQPANQSTSQPASQPTNQPTHRLTTDQPTNTSQIAQNNQQSRTPTNKLTPTEQKPKRTHYHNPPSLPPFSQPGEVSTRLSWSTATGPRPKGSTCRGRGHRRCTRWSPDTSMLLGPGPSVLFCSFFVSGRLGDSD